MAFDDNHGEIRQVNIEHDYLSDVMHFMNTNARKTASYKYAYFKSILDNLFNVDDNYELSFSYLAEDFSIMYWNIIAKYKLPQYQNGGRSLIEKVIYEMIEKDNLIDGVDFYSLNDEAQQEYLKRTKDVTKINVVGALYSDLNEAIYGFDKRSRKIWFTKESYEFLVNYKSALEKLNYYSWILWMENILNIRNEEASNLAIKLDCSNKRSSLERFKNDLFKLGDEPVCFYCGKPLKECHCHMDHFIPWSFVHDDKIWNIVYSCSKCNESKNNKIPDKKYLFKLIDRNRSIMDNSYDVELLRLYQAALHNGFIVWSN